MARTIAVSDDVYELLKKSKLSGESYSDAIRRELKRYPRLNDIAGSRTINAEQWEKTRRIVNSADKLSRKKLSRTR